MLDGLMRGVIDAPLNESGRWLAARGATANGVTLAGL
ncbi:MAG: phosphatidylglycerophosphate synthase, partial [Rhodobacterales bacterium 32-66-9]